MSDVQYLRIPGDLRPYGMYIAGNPGMGKTSLVQALALRDVQKGHGVCVIDPTGDLVNRLVHHIPKERVRDTIWFDSTNPKSMDFFSYHDAAEREVLTDMLVNIFDIDEAKRQAPYLYRILDILFDYNDRVQPHDRAVIMDIKTFIENEKYREKTIYNVCPHKRWDHMPKPGEFDAILSRLIRYEAIPSLNQCLMAKIPEINIWDVMQTNKIFLVNLQDTPSAHFLGALISAKFQQAAFRRREIKDESKRSPFYLYIDECNTVMKYAAKEFETIMIRARKYKLCLTMTNQIPNKLPKEIKESIGTIGSLVLFQLDVQDGNIFKHRIAPYSPDYLVNLEQYRAIARVGNKVYKVKTPVHLGFSPASYAPTIMNRTIHTYACDTPEVCSTKEHGNHAPSSGKGDEINPTEPLH